MTDDERDAAVEYLRGAIPRIRRRAASVGAMHTGWDLIGSIEHYTKGSAPYGFDGDDGLRDLVAMVERDYPERPR